LACKKIKEVSEKNVEIKKFNHEEATNERSVGIKNDATLM